MIVLYVATYLIAISIADHFLQPTMLDNNLTFGDCFTTFLCSSLLDDEEICYIKYGRDPSYQNFDDILNGSLNSPSLLPLMDEETQYYFQTGLMVNSTLYQLRTSFTTGKCTDTNDHSMHVMYENQNAPCSTY